MRGENLYQIIASSLYEVKACGLYEVKACGLYEVKACGLDEVKACGLDEVKTFSLTKHLSESSGQLIRTTGRFHATSDAFQLADHIFSLHATHQLRDTHRVSGTSTNELDGVDDTCGVINIQYYCL